MQKRLKFGALVIAVAMFAGVAAPASAVTIAELQAQIEALMAQLKALQGDSGANTSYTFTQNLTVGSTGADVTSLQQFLVGKGFLNMPTGVSYGYFGPLTKSAVAAWQAANGVSPAVGYWGPISRAAANAMGGTTTGGTTTPGSTAGISTPGVEGTLTATLYPTPASGTKLYEGADKTDVMGIELEAKLSDIRVERLKVQIPAITYYREVASRIYVMDGSTVLASADLNSDTVVKESSSYYITITGFNLVIPKDAKKVINIAVDALSSVDSTYRVAQTLTVPASGIRGVDGAGINLYAPTTAFSRSHTPTVEQAENATIAVSLNSSSPDTQQVICYANADEDECEKLELAKINFKAEKDDIKVTDYVVGITRGVGTTATATVAYLYDGSTVVGSATVAGTSATAMTATFSDIDWIVPADTTKTLSVRLDITDAELTATTFYVTSSTVTAENSLGTSKTATGSATGNTFTLRKVGPEVSLVSQSIATSGVPQTSSSPSSTSTLTAKFSIKIKAVGGDLTLGTISSSTAPVIDSDGTSFTIYRNGVQDLTMSSAATSTAYTIPSTCTSVGTNSCTLAEGAEVTIDATYQILGRVTAGTAVTSGLYAVQFEGIQWFNATTGAVQTTTFMTGDVDWRTTAVSFP